MNNKSKNRGYLEYYAEIAAIKKKLKGEGSYYFHLGKGDVDRKYFPTPKCLLEKVKAALDLQYYKYSHPLGRTDTRNLLAFYHNLLTGGNHYSSNNVALLISATSGLNAVVNVLKEKVKLKKALVTRPSYINYRYVFEKFGVDLVKVDSTRENNFNVGCDEVISVLKSDKEVKLVVLCNPNFPFGRFMEKDCFKDILNYCEKNDIFLLLDNVFETSAFKNTDMGKYMTADYYSPNIIRIYNYSKDLGVAGFRIGYLLTNEWINEAMSDEIDVTYGSPQTVFEPFIDCNTLLRILSAFGTESYIRAVD